MVSDDQAAAKWTPAVLKGMCSLFSLVLHICIVEKPKLADYFSFDPVYHCSFPKICHISKNKFNKMLTYLHVSDNTNYIARGQPNHDPLFKIRPVLTASAHTMKECYYPARALTIDEGMCPYRGRVNYRVYMKQSRNIWDALRIYM